MNESVNSDPDPGSLLRRRDFLALGSAGLLAPFFKNLAWAESLSMAEAVLPMPVGYLEGSESLRNLHRLPRKVLRPALAVQQEEKAMGESSPVVVPAAGLFQGDTNLPGQPLHIHVHGLYPPMALESKLRRQLPLTVDLEAIFPSPDPAFPEPLRFYVWGLRRKQGWNPSPPTQFVFPLDWNALPQFVMRVVLADGTPVSLRTRFTLDNESGRPRLRRGVYLFGLTPGAWSRETKLAEFARFAPIDLFSVLVSMETEPEA
jgi:hypothetical protein